MISGQRDVAGWLPSLRFGPYRWRLPLFHPSSQLLVEIFLGESRPVAEIRRRLRRDPALLIFTALSVAAKHRPVAGLSKSFDPVSDRPAATDPTGVTLGQLAEWLRRDASRCFADDDGLSLPAYEERFGRRWRTLDDYFATLPLSRWLSEASLWLEVSGPPVPEDWRATWPTLLPEGPGDPEDPEEIEATNVAENRHQGEATGTAVGPHFGSSAPAAGRSDSADGGQPERRSSLPSLVARRSKVGERWQQAFGRQVRSAYLGAIRELAYGLSHEINNPLANISTRAQQLQQTEDDPQRLASLQRIVDQAYRAHAMIADLMFFANPPAVRPRPFDLAETVRQSLAAVADEAAALNIELRYPVAKDRLEPVADAAMIGEAVVVFVRNAIEAIGASGLIVVEVASDGDHAIVRVADSGPGLSEQARRHAFDPYYSGREAGRGLGLGLCRAYRIAQLHGGDVELSAAPAGCVATLRIPLAFDPGSSAGRSDPIRDASDSPPGSARRVAKRTSASPD